MFMIMKSENACQGVFTQNTCMPPWPRSSGSLSAPNRSRGYRQRVWHSHSRLGGLSPGSMHLLLAFCASVQQYVMTIQKTGQYISSGYGSLLLISIIRSRYLVTHSWYSFFVPIGLSLKAWIAFLRC